MLHSLAVALLVAPSPAPADDLLLDLLPGDSTIAVRVGDLASHLERPAAERGSWESFLADERFVSLVVMGLEGAEFGDAEEIDALGILTEIARFVEGGAIGMPSFEPDAVTGILRLREGYIDAWSGLLGHLGESFETMEVAGLDAHVIGAGTGGVLALVDVGGLTVISAGDEIAAMDGARAQILALEDGPGAGRWWDDVPERADDAVLEAYIGFGALATESAELAMMDRLVQGLYLGIGMGEGDAGELLLGASLFENDVAEAFASAMRPADLGLASRVPSDASTLTIGCMDFVAFLDACGVFVDSLEPSADAGAAIDQGLEVASEFLGLDIEDDLLGNMTGHMVIAQWLDDVSLIASMDDGSDPTALVEAFPLIGFGVEDEEPFFELIEIAVGLLGPGADVLESDLGTELVLTPPDAPEVTFRVLVADGWVVLGADEQRVHDFVRGDVGVGWLAEGEADRAVSTLPAPGYAFMRAPWLAEAMLFALESGGEMSGVPSEAYDAIEALSEHVDAKVVSGIALTPRWVSANFKTF